MIRESLQVYGDVCASLRSLYDGGPVIGSILSLEGYGYFVVLKLWLDDRLHENIKVAPIEIYNNTSFRILYENCSDFRPFSPVNCRKVFCSDLSVFKVIREQLDSYNALCNDRPLRALYGRATPVFEPSYVESTWTVSPHGRIIEAESN